MKRNLEFGIKISDCSTTLTVSGPTGPLRTAGRRRRPKVPEVEEAEKHNFFRYFEFKPGTNAAQRIGQVAIDVRKARGIQNRQQGRKALCGVLNYLHFLGSGQAEHMDPDPDIQLFEGIINQDAAEDRLAAIVKAPGITNLKGLEEVVERSMYGMARDLGYGSRAGDSDKKIGRNLARIINVSISPDDGVVLAANVNNGARFTTGKDYDPESGLVCLRSQDANPAQRFICLAGAVELAQAER